MAWVSEGAESQAIAPAAASSQDQATPITDLSAELRRISAALNGKPSAGDLVKLRDSLPREWAVATSEGQYKISTEYLRTQLIAGSKENAKVWTDHLGRALDSYSQEQTTNGLNPRAELDHILAGAEFASVHPPTAWDLFRQRLAAWMARLLLRLFGGLARYPAGGQILFWIIVTACVAFIAFWIFRFMISRDRMDTLPQGHIPVAARTWQEWIRAAREAAARDDFREAVHSAYWAGITRLEDLGMVPKDRSMTPREYLRVVAESVPGDLAPRTRYREPLSGLTTSMERIWYANRGAVSKDYGESLRHLEELGCQLE